MKAIIKEPGKASRYEWVKNDLESLQKAVDGYIETNTFHGFVVICDEEGRLKGKPYCCTVGKVSFVGTVLVVGTYEDDFSDVTIPMPEWKWLIGEEE